jgi:hypothetical protein
MDDSFSFPAVESAWFFLVERCYSHFSVDAMGVVSRATIRNNEKE